MLPTSSFAKGVLAPNSKAAPRAGAAERTFMGVVEHVQRR